jgi:penicillin-binding protein 2
MDQYPSEEDIALVREGKGAAPIGTARKPADVPLPTGVGASVAMGLVAVPEPTASGASAPASAPAAAASAAPSAARGAAVAASRPAAPSAAAPAASGGTP